MKRAPVSPLSGLSRRSALGHVAAVGAALGLGSRVGRVAAQDATPSSLAAHPLTGTWLTVNPGGVTPSIYGPDGSVVVAFPPNYVDPTLGLTFQGPALGRWEADGERRGHFMVIQALSDAAGAYAGSFQFEGHPTVSEDGHTFSDGERQRVIVRDASNSVVFDQVNPVNPPISAIRLDTTMESVVLPVASPTAGTPTT
jgi:hypothetical protein